MVLISDLSAKPEISFLKIRLVGTQSTGTVWGAG